MCEVKKGLMCVKTHARLIRTLALPLKGLANLEFKEPRHKTFDVINNTVLCNGFLFHATDINIIKEIKGDIKNQP